MNHSHRTGCGSHQMGRGITRLWHARLWQHREGWLRAVGAQGVEEWIQLYDMEICVSRDRERMHVWIWTARWHRGRGIHIHIAKDALRPELCELQDGLGWSNFSQKGWKSVGTVFQGGVLMWHSFFRTLQDGRHQAIFYSSLKPVAKKRKARCSQVRLQFLEKKRYWGLDIVNKTFFQRSKYHEIPLCFHFWGYDMRKRTPRILTHAGFLRFFELSQFKKKTSPPTVANHSTTMWSTPGFLVWAKRGENVPHPTNKFHRQCQEFEEYGWKLYFIYVSPMFHHIFFPRFTRKLLKCAQNFLIDLSTSTFCLRPFHQAPPGLPFWCPKDHVFLPPHQRHHPDFTIQNQHFPMHLAFKAQFSLLEKRWNGGSVRGWNPRNVWCFNAKKAWIKACSTFFLSASFSENFCGIQKKI